MHNLIMFYTKSYYDTFMFKEGPPLHDPCAMAYVFDESLFDVVYVNVDVETMSTLTYGHTVVDLFNVTGKPANCYVTRDMKVDCFFDMMIDALEVADKHSPLGSGK